MGLKYDVRTTEPKSHRNDTNQAQKNLSGMMTHEKDSNPFSFSAMCESGLDDTARFMAKWKDARGEIV